MLELQQLAGNRATTAAVQRFVEQEAEFGRNPFSEMAGDKADGGAASTAEASDTGPTGENPILGLQKGDGLNFGTWHRRERVKVLQSKLNEVMDAPPLKLDGMWGNDTQTYLDGLHDGVGLPRSSFIGDPLGGALMNGLNGVLDLMNKLKGDVDPVADEVEGPPSSLLEAAFDQITLQFSEMLQAQTAGLARLRADLGTPEQNAPSFLGDLIIKGADFVFDKTLVGDTSLHKTVKDAATGLPDALSEKIVDKPFNEAKSGAGALVRGVVAPAATGANVGDFFESQQHGLIGSFHRALKAFLDGKPQLRMMTVAERDALNSTGVDARLSRAAQVLGGLIQATATAGEKTFQEALKAWTMTTARQGLLDKGSGRSDVTDMQFLGGIGEVPGVLEIEVDFDADRAKAPVRPISARIEGLSPTLRAQLTKDPRTGQSATIGGTGFPTRLFGDKTKSGFFEQFDAVNLGVTRDETGFVQNTPRTDDQGAEWLVERGDGDRTGRDGILSMFKDVDPFTLEQIGGLQS